MIPALSLLVKEGFSVASRCAYTAAWSYLPLFVSLCTRESSHISASPCLSSNAFFQLSVLASGASGGRLGLLSAWEEDTLLVDLATSLTSLLVRLALSANKRRPNNRRRNNDNKPKKTGNNNAEDTQKQ